MFGSRDLGVWEQGRDDPDADMDDWLLEDLETDDDGDEAEAKDEKKRDGTSS